MYLSICLSIYLTNYLSIYLTIYLSNELSIFLSIYLTDYLFILLILHWMSIESASNAKFILTSSECTIHTISERQMNSFQKTKHIILTTIRSIDDIFTESETDRKSSGWKNATYLITSMIRFAILVI